MVPLATVAILSIGEMGMGIAKLLVAHNYRVVTNLEGRSQDTHARAERASIEALPSDLSLITESDYILSIVPPRDAVSIATRISTAFTSLSTPKKTPLYFLDLNAVSPRSARSIGEIFSTKAPAITFLDGCIIGSAPTQKLTPTPSTTEARQHPKTSLTWSQPSIPISGSVASVPASFAQLAETLNFKHISEDVGIASGLKCCFATVTKGFTALCIQAFTTASNLGVLPALIEEMEEKFPASLKTARYGVTSMPPKAYRWVKESKFWFPLLVLTEGRKELQRRKKGRRLANLTCLTTVEEISAAHEEDGGFESAGKGLFNEIAKVYESVADDSVLGEEKTERRKRGLTIEDVAAAMGEGNAAKRKKDA
ncbi:hypothetical protein LHYA1_G006966 [Lachnellula hyalina]|uniref:6-phosphogluconate dehydrogenase C-terminal domain-like protein n=1 Tax=Lachnellula hyalina TaxID=1316788 RepID=A0A8H8TXM9_9HELO|nr:uncharacterized protein LHYA1_G006966 [Lachnellula hyalina]TVY24067.1 hypothetical protein LHYA1_G006966 [Lachnellula hyalina]